MKPLIPIIASTCIGVASTAQVTLPVSEAAWWANVVERWGIAGVMFLCLVWATKRIEAGDKARLEVVKDNADRLDKYHAEMKNLVTDSTSVNAQVSVAILSLASELDRRPCQMGDARKRTSPIGINTSKP